MFSLRQVVIHFSFLPKRYHNVNNYDQVSPQFNAYASLRVFIYTYICIYMCASHISYTYIPNIYIYIYVYAYMYIYIYIHKCIRTYMYMYVRIYICIYIQYDVINFILFQIFISIGNFSLDQFPIHIFVYINTPVYTIILC